MSTRPKKLLLHACCTPCVTHPYRLLLPDYSVTVFFYNPNIHPESEYLLRLREIEKLSLKWGFAMIAGEYDVDTWFEVVKGHEADPEGGERCALCYRFRLAKTAEIAHKQGFDLFATTLSISPLKKAVVINRIGEEVSSGSGIEYYEADFKKRDGFKISIQISHEERLYRQDFCGCVFSQHEREKRRQP